jgi:hypothetical protein
MHSWRVHGRAKPGRTCVDEPTAMPREIAILFLYAKMTADACSAALPTIGTRIVAMKS